MRRLHATDAVTGTISGRDQNRSAALAAGPRRSSASEPGTTTLLLAALARKTSFSLKLLASLRQSTTEARLGHAETASRCGRNRRFATRARRRFGCPIEPAQRNDERRKTGDGHPHS